MYDYFMEDISLEEYKEIAKEEEKIVHEAIDQLLLSNQRFLIIEGPAGSGKTEAIRYLQQKWEKGKYVDFRKDRIKVAYSAPSRQAASNLRLRDISYARTTQKYLSDFYHKERDPEKLNLLVVDEASLLPKSQVEEIYHKTKVNSNIKFIFLGDSSQNFPWCPKKKREEKFFPALDHKTLINIFGLSKEVDLIHPRNHIEKIELTAPWRYISGNNPMSESFITLLRNLREGAIDLTLTSLPECPEINQFKEDDLISNLININSSGLARDIKKLIDSKLSKEESIEQCITLLKSSYYWENNEKRSFNEFNEDALKKGIELRFDLSKSRPAMGEIYNQKFKANKNKSPNVISLFRSNEHVHQANLALRPHLEHVKKEEIEELVKKYKLPLSMIDHLPVKGDILYIAGEDDREEHASQGESSKYQESLFPGDLVVATSDPSKPKSSLLDELFGDKNYFFDIQLRPLIYLPDSIGEKIGQFIVRQSRECTVWIGGMVENRIDAYKLYRNQIEMIKEKYEEINKTVLNRQVRVQDGPGFKLLLEDEDYFNKALNSFKISTKEFKNNFLLNITNYGSEPAYPWESISPTARRRKIAPTIRGVTSYEIMKMRESLIESDLHFLRSLLNNSILIYYAYALTHKTAQGGEWENVIIESADVWEDINKNRFLYTALSRSTNKVYLSYFK